MRNNLQRDLFEKILLKFPKKSSAVESLSKILGTGKDAIYRRFRGDTLLTPDEIVLLCQYFNLSIDAYIYENTDTVFFRYNPFSEPIENFQDYFDPILNDLQQIRKLPDSKISYTSAEIPIFYYALFPDLMNFKLYVWGRTVWNFPSLRQQVFDFNLIPAKVIEASTQILTHYNQIPSTELWSIHIVDYTLNQLEYHVQSGGFKRKEDALYLCKILLKLMDHLRLMARLGKKFDTKQRPETGAEFNLFHNEMIYTNNTILAKTVLETTVYTSYCNPNFLRSNDKKLSDYTTNWFDLIIEKSNPISNHAEKNRAWFFNRIKEKIEFTLEKLA